MDENIEELEKKFINSVMHQAKVIGLSGKFEPFDLGKGEIGIKYTSNVSPLTIERCVCCFKLRGRKLSVWIDNFRTELEPINDLLLSPRDIMNYSSLVATYTKTIEDKDLNFYNQVMNKK